RHGGNNLVVVLQAPKLCALGVGRAVQHKAVHGPGNFALGLGLCEAHFGWSVHMLLHVTHLLIDIVLCELTEWRSELGDAHFLMMFFLALAGGFGPLAR